MRYGFLKGFTAVKSLATKRHEHILVCLVISGCTLIAFWPLQHAAFTNYDDNLYIFENYRLFQGFTWEAVCWAFKDFHTGYWHPLTWLSLMVDYRLFGMNAGGYHWGNVLFHLANSLLLYLVLRKMTALPIRSAAVPLLFALHPLHVESVAWISERKDVLSALFFFLSILVYVQYVEKRSRIKYFTLLILFSMGLMSKPSIVVLPCILLLLDYWPLQRIFPFQGVALKESKWERWLALTDKLPLFFMSSVIGIATFGTAEKMGAVVSLANLPFCARLQNALLSYGLYLKKMIWPFDLAVFYPLQTSVPFRPFALSVLTLTIITGFALRWFRSRPYLGVGWFWYLGVLFPVSGLFQSGAQSMADRYTYLSLVGVFIALVWGAADIVQRWRISGPHIVLAAIPIILLLTGLCRVQVGYWQDNISLFEHAIQVTQNNYVAHNALGLSLANQGKIEEALNQYRQALKIQPNYVRANNNMGLTLMEKGENSKAIRYFQAAIALDPHHASAYNNMGIALAKTGDTEGAIRNFRRALEMKPHDPNTHNNLGISFLAKRDYRTAAGYFLNALELNPHDVSVLNNLKRCIAHADDSEAAKEHIQKALRMEPNVPEAYKILEGVMTQDVQE